MTDLNVDVNDGQVDAAIRYGVGRYQNALAERILNETVTPVCSPAYLDSVVGLAAPVDLTRCTLLHEDRMLANWEQWFALAGIHWHSKRGSAYSHGSMAVEDAIRGTDVALGRSAIVGDDIAAGRLVAPFLGIQLRAERGYDLLSSPEVRETPKLEALRDWLHEEIESFRTASGFTG